MSAASPGGGRPSSTVASTQAAQRSAAGASTHHAGEPGVHRQGRRAPAGGRCRAGRGRPSRARASSRARRGRRVEPREVERVAAPGVELEREAGQLDAEDLGLGERAAGGVLDLRPQPPGDAGTEATGAPGALVGRCPRRRDGPQPGHAGAGVDGRLTGEPGVDDDVHALDGERRLGDVGGEDDAAAAAGDERPVLLGRRERPVQRQHLGVDARQRVAARG